MKVYASTFVVTAATITTVFFTLVNQFIATPPGKSELYTTETTAFDSLIVRILCVFILALIVASLLAWLYKMITAK